MGKENIFMEDVSVPKIVQKKADAAFLTIKTERNCEMKDRLYTKQNIKKSAWIRKRAAGMMAAAACMAAVIAAGTLAGPLRDVLVRSKANHADTDWNGAKDALLTAVDQVFTLQVKAAESGEGEKIPLAEGQPVSVAFCNDKAGSWVLGANDANGDLMDYCINIPSIVCEGENIESITYSINHGAFQIVQPKQEKSIIIDGQLYGKKLNTGSIGGDYNEERDGEPSRPFETVLYQSFTVDYSRQEKENTWINICNERPDSAEIIQLIWKDGRTNEEFLHGVEKMLDDTVITCTVNYTDNTSQSADIKVGGRMMTRKEAGERLDPGMSPEELLDETIVITFELQRQKERTQ